MLQEDGDPAGVPLNLHSQNAVTRPPLPHHLQTVDGRAREGDVNVGEDEEDKERLGKMGKEGELKTSDKVLQVIFCTMTRDNGH